MANAVRHYVSKQEVRIPSLFGGRPGLFGGRPGLEVANSRGCIQLLYEGWVPTRRFYGWPGQ